MFPLVFGSSSASTRTYVVGFEDPPLSPLVSPGGQKWCILVLFGAEAAGDRHFPYAITAGWEKCLSPYPALLLSSG